MAQSFVFTVICGLENDFQCPDNADSIAFKQQIKEKKVDFTLNVETSGNDEQVTLIKIYFYETPSDMIGYNRDVYMGLASVTNKDLIFDPGQDTGLAVGFDSTPSGEKVLQDFFDGLFASLRVEGIRSAWQSWMVVPVDSVQASSSLSSSGGSGR